MQRGQKRESYTREQMDHIKSQMKPRAEYKNKKDYSRNFNQIAKKRGYFIPKKKRLDTHDVLLEDKKKTDNENIQLKQENKKSKEELKDRDTTIDALRSQMNELKYRVHQAENDKEVLYRKESSESQNITIPGMRF